MSKLYPFKFTPHLKPVLWGGTRILDFKNISSASNNIGESWEISGFEGCESIISNGEFQGIDIKSLLEAHGNEILGTKLYDIYGNKFPLLIKFLDANQNLSIQVHPDDKLAKTLNNSFGKTELWYIIDAVKDSYIYSGFSKEITKSEFIEHISNDSITDVISKFTPNKRDIFYLPAGRIHSCGGGCFFVEIQQTSDITFRVYDYNRIDANGEKRELHTDLAKEALDFNVHNDCIGHVDVIYNEEQVIKRSPYFTATVLDITKSFKLEIAKFESFRIIIITKGSGTLIDCNGNECDITQGETVLIPANTDFVNINPVGEMEIITSYIPV